MTKIPHTTQTSHQIKAVIFDCYGVLTTDGWLAFRDQYLTPGSDADESAVELNRQADAGLVDEAEFISQLAELSGVERDRVEQLINHSFVRNDVLFMYIEQYLAGSYQIGLLSNAADDYTEKLFTPEQNALFDEKVFSYQVGQVKPHPLMYETIARRLGMLTEECVFIDDREAFVLGAHDAGMQALQYHSVQKLKQELPVVLQGVR